MREINLQLVKKDTKTYTIRLTRNGSAIDISNWSIYFSVKSDWNDLDASAKILKTVLLPSNAESEAGIGYLSLTSDDTDLDIGEFYYDLKLIDTGYRQTVMRGKLVVVPSIRIA